jgi:hypothetical protein
MHNQNENEGVQVIGNLSDCIYRGDYGSFESESKLIGRGMCFIKEDTTEQEWKFRCFQPHQSGHWGAGGTQGRKHCSTTC